MAINSFKVSLLRELIPGSPAKGLGALPPAGALPVFSGPGVEEVVDVTVSPGVGAAAGR